MIATGTTPKKAWTEAELESLPEGEHLLPGFSYASANLFKEWDWG